jgi:hypothetical protein
MLNLKMCKRRREEDKKQEYMEYMNDDFMLHQNRIGGR